MIGSWCAPIIEGVIRSMTPCNFVWTLKSTDITKPVDHLSAAVLKALQHLPGRSSGDAPLQQRKTFA